MMNLTFDYLYLQKKKFDSADYFTEHEKLKKAAGLDGGKNETGGEGKEEAKKSS